MFSRRKRTQPPADLPTMRPGIGQRSHTVPRPTIKPLKIAPDDSKRHANRWSEMVPPQTALTFVAMYDPSEGLIGFSGSSLLPFDAASGLALPRTPGFPQDGQSEVFAIDHLGTITPAISTGALTSDTALRDMQSMLSAYFRGETHRKSESDALNAAEHATPRVSSTLEGLYHERRESQGMAMVDDALVDPVYEETVFSDDFIPCSMRSPTLEPLDEHDSGYASAGEDTIDARTGGPRPVVDSFFVLDDYPYDPRNEHSAFSVTTTSTSSYIEVNTPSTAAFRRPATPDSDKTWPVIDEHMEMEMESLNVLAYLQPRPKTPNQRLRKPSALVYSSSPSSSPSSPSSQRSTKKLWKGLPLIPTATQPASPADVLAREYNHHWNDGEAKPPSPQKPVPRLRNTLSKRFLRLAKGGDENCWVLVEIEHKVIQHDLHDDDM